MIESKAPLTEEQKTAIRSIQQPVDVLQTKTDQQSSQTGEITYAQVMDKLQNAKNSDELDLAADWIKYVNGASLQKELSDKYEALRANAA
jgi:hypothetical protein